MNSALPRWCSPFPRSPASLIRGVPPRRRQRLGAAGSREAPFWIARSVTAPVITRNCAPAAHFPHKQTSVHCHRPTAPARPSQRALLFAVPARYIFARSFPTAAKTCRNGEHGLAQAGLRAGATRGGVAELVDALGFRSKRRKAWRFESLIRTTQLSAEDGPVVYEQVGEQCRLPKRANEGLKRDAARSSSRPESSTSASPIAWTR